jgi:hypothetical protein
LREKDLSLSDHFSSLQQKHESNSQNLEPDVLDFVGRWKLDLSEGFEQQRRRLLPNHEFHGFYNLEEDATYKTSLEDAPVENGADFLAGGGQTVATVELLKDLNLKMATRDENRLDDFDEHDDATGSSMHDPKAEYEDAEQDEQDRPAQNEDSSIYELINGLLQAGDYPERSYNVRRCTGLEVTKALLLWCSEVIYIMDGFEQTIGEDREPGINRVQKEQTSFNVALRQKNSTAESKPAPVSGPGNSIKRAPPSRAKSVPGEQPTSEVIYQHRSKRIYFYELYAVFCRRYQLQQIALEFLDINKQGTLIAFDGNKEREEVLGKILQSKLSNSIFHSSY